MQLISHWSHSLRATPPRSGSDVDYTLIWHESVGCTSMSNRHRSEGPVLCECIQNSMVVKLISDSVIVNIITVTSHGCNGVSDHRQLVCLSNSLQRLTFVKVTGHKGPLMRKYCPCYYVSMKKPLEALSSVNMTSSVMSLLTLLAPIVKNA